MDLLGKLAIKNTSKIGILPSASKYVSVKFEEQFLHILNNNDQFNGLKVITKMKIYGTSIQISITFLQCSKELLF